MDGKTRFRQNYAANQRNFPGILIFMACAACFAGGAIISFGFYDSLHRKTTEYMPNYLQCSPEPSINEDAPKEENISSFVFPPWAGEIGGPQVVRYELPEPENNSIPTYLFVAVQSSPQNFFRRALIRKSWGDPMHYPFSMTLKFIVGKSNNISVANNLRLEKEEKGDIIEGDFPDTYDNLPLKTHLSIHSFVSMSDPGSLLLKIDDDVFLNPYGLTRKFEPDRDFPKTLICFLMKDRKPIRDPESKWFVSRLAYPSDNYPDYCLGMAYFVSFELAGALLTLAPSVPAQKSEDLYFTGILREQIENALLIDITQSYYHGHEEEDYTETYMKILDGEDVFAHLWQEYAVEYSNLWNDILDKNYGRY